VVIGQGATTAGVVLRQMFDGVLAAVALPATFMSSW
jgi:hypothetical protein